MYATNFLQTTTNALWVCNSLAMNVYLWMNFKYYLFGSFTELSGAFFQNLLSRVISLNNIYNSMQAKQLAGDQEGIYYDLARLCRILIDFSPVETSPLDINNI